MMSKRIFGLLMATALLLGSLCLPAMAAYEVTDVVMVHNCDSNFGTLVVEATHKSEGNASLRLPLKDEGFQFASSTRDLKVDASRADTLAVDFYFSDPEKIINALDSMTLELTSCGTYDNAEIAFNIKAGFKDYMTGLKKGWNTLYFVFSGCNRTFAPDEIDMAKINFMRIYGTFFAQDGLADETLLIDNIRVCQTGGALYGDLEHLVSFTGDNSDVDIDVSGISRPNVNRRHEEISANEGKKLEESEKVVVPETSLKQPSVSVNPEDQPTRPTTPTTPSNPTTPDDSSSDSQASASDRNNTMLVLVIVICAAVVVVALAVLVLIIVLSKKKKQS